MKIFGVILLIAVVAFLVMAKKTNKDSSPGNLAGESDTKVEVPSVNPIERTNPFQDVYKNPFE